VLIYRGRICLPKIFSAATSREGNVTLYALKTIIGALAIRETWLDREAGAMQRLVAYCASELPFLEKFVAEVEQSLAPESNLWELLGPLADDNALIEGTALTFDKIPDTDNTNTVTEIEGKGQVDVQVEPEKEDDGEGADMPMHTFEKVETAEEYTGHSRKTDDEDELEEHKDALKEMEMKRVIRSRERPRSIYRSDIVLDSAEWDLNDDSPATGIPYPEWDYARQHYRSNWCFIDQSVKIEVSAQWLRDAERRNANLVRVLKRQFATLANAQLRVKRQPTGPDFDLDALVERHIRVRASQPPNEAIYIDPRRRLHDVAALIVMDESFSTDSYLTGARVLDTIADIIFCVGEVLSEFDIEFSVAGFSSNTRRHCDFSIVKAFDDKWSEARGKLGGLNANGYTRIGPALRHGARLLKTREAERKVIILVTDGRPCDYDRYEGTYGVHDVKKAIEEAHLENVMTYAFAIDKQAREHFHLMFTPHHYNVVTNPTSLSISMCNLFGRLKLGG
jgi:nitric oxide reductase NorD protein